MAPSRRPLTDHAGSAWLGDPQSPDFRIEIADDAIGFHAPSGVTRVPWRDVRSMDIDIPVANWTAARLSHRVLGSIDVLNTANSDGVAVGNHLRFGNTMIDVRITRSDGSEVRGAAQKHQPLGYPQPEVTAALAVLQGRLHT